MAQDIFSQYYIVADEICNEISALREKSISLDPAELRGKFQQHLANYREKCQKIGLDNIQTEKTVYALVAAIDEAALSFGGDISSFWMISTLQFEYYHDNLAGQKFYSEFDEILNNAANMPMALYLYYRLMAIGFEGQYIDNAAKREELMNKGARVLVKMTSSRIPMADYGEPVKAVSKKTFSLPYWVYAVAALTIIVISWTMNKTLSSAVTNNAVQQIEATLTVDGKK